MMMTPEIVRSYVVSLETALGRRWSSDDNLRTMSRSCHVLNTTTTNNNTVLRDQIHYELIHLLGVNPPERHAAVVGGILLRFYLVLLAEMSAIEDDVEYEDEDEDEEHNGLSEEAIGNQLKTRAGAEAGDDSICSVCQDYLYPERIATLDCSHEFHVQCIVEWLRRGNNFCPLCKAVAVPPPPGNSSQIFTDFTRL